MKFKLSYNEPFEINSYINNVNRTVDLTTDMLPPLVVTITSSGNSITSDVTFEEAWNAIYNEHRSIYIRARLIYNNNEDIIATGFIDGTSKYNTSFAAAVHIYGNTPGTPKLICELTTGWGMTYTTSISTTGTDASMYNPCIYKLSWTSSSIDFQELYYYGGNGKGITFFPPEDFSQESKTSIIIGGELKIADHEYRSYTGDAIVIRNDLLSYVSKDDLSSIPTVNNGTLTIKKNGTNVATFTANQSGSSTANITVPTNVSELTDGAEYLKYQLLPDKATYDALTVKDSTKLYLIPESND